MAERGTKYHCPLCGGKLVIPLYRGGGMLSEISELKVVNCKKCATDWVIREINGKLISILR